jgi:pimeloyl-ACP methyl ester carboxylesterase
MTSVRRHLPGKSNGAARTYAVVAGAGAPVTVHEWPGGRAGAPTVVLAHAAGLHGMVWAPVVAALGEGFRCVAVDLRGHGDSAARRDEDFDWGGFAADVLAVVNGEGGEAPFGLGHSAGATALLMAEQARPGTFGALYCYEPTIVVADPPLGRDPDSWLAGAARRRRGLFPSREDAYRHYATRPPFSAVAPEALRAYVEHGFADLEDGSVRLKCRPAHEALVYEMAAAHDCYGRLPEVSCPVRLACGARSDAVRPDAMAALAARLPRGSAQVLAGLGHLGPLEDPVAVAAAFREFASELGSGTVAPEEGA